MYLTSSLLAPSAGCLRSHPATASWSEMAQFQLLPISSVRSDGASLPAPTAWTTACSAACHCRMPKARAYRLGCSLQHAATVTTQPCAHDRQRRVLLLLLIVTASYAHRRLGPRCSSMIPVIVTRVSSVSAHRWRRCPATTLRVCLPPLGPRSRRSPGRLRHVCTNATYGNARMLSRRCS